MHKIDLGEVQFTLGKAAALFFWRCPLLVIREYSGGGIECIYEDTQQSREQQIDIIVAGALAERICAGQDTNPCMGVAKFMTTRYACDDKAAAKTKRITRDELALSLARIKPDVVRAVSVSPEELEAMARAIERNGVSIKLPLDTAH